VALESHYRIGAGWRTISGSGKEKGIPLRMMKRGEAWSRMRRMSI